jgi:hypothetical protein
LRLAEYGPDGARERMLAFAEAHGAWLEWPAD